MRNLFGKNEIWKQLKQLFHGGLFHIFGSSVLAEAGGLISSIVVIRHLPKLDYGQYVAANNLYSYLTVFIGLGLTSAVIQFCSERIEQEEKDAIYRFSFRAGSLFNLLLAGVVVLLSLWKRHLGQPEVAKYLFMMAGIPIATYLTALMQVILRVLRKNKEYSAVNVSVTISKVLGNILFTLFWGVSGLIVSIYVYNIVSALVAAWFLHREGFFRTISLSHQTLPWKRKREITLYAGLCSITNLTSIMLTLLDVTCLGFVLSDETVLADYQVAATIPAACLFVPTGLITYFYPQMVERMSGAGESAVQELRRLLKLFTAVAAVMAILLIVFAPLIIWVIYGQKYMNIVPIFRILSLNFFVFAAFRKLFGNVIAAMKQVKMNLIHTLSCGLCNIALNLLLIPRYASVGAAVATLLSGCLVVVLEAGFLHRYLRHA